MPTPSSQQAHSLYNGASAYSNRYPQTQAPYPQQSQHPDPFASLSANNSNIGSGLPSQYGLAAHDTISPYLSAQQQQNQPGSQQASVGAPSPVPASTRDVGTPAALPPSATSAYGGFTSAINQAQQQQPQQQQQHPTGYPTDYASLYGLQQQQQQQDPMRNFVSLRGPVVDGDSSGLVAHYSVGLAR